MMANEKVEAGSCVPLARERQKIVCSLLVHAYKAMLLSLAKCSVADYVAVTPALNMLSRAHVYIFTAKYISVLQTGASRIVVRSNCS